MIDEVEEHRDELRRIALFEGFEADAFDRILDKARIRELAESERLFDHRQPAGHYFYVLSGEVKIFRVAPDGGEKVIETFRPGHMFAEAVMFMSEAPTFPVSAEAIRASRVIAFDHATTMSALEGSKEACYRLMATMSRRLKMLIDEIDRLTLHNATFRFVYYLLQQIPEGAAEWPEIMLSTPKHVIASKLGVQPETFSRIEARLVKDGLLDIKGTHVVLRDIDALRALIEI